MLDRLGWLEHLQLRGLLHGVSAQRGVHAEQPQHVDEAERHLPLATPDTPSLPSLSPVARQRVLLKVDDRLIQHLLLWGEAAEQKMSRLGGKRGAKNCCGGAAQYELFSDP